MYNQSMNTLLSYLRLINSYIVYVYIAICIILLVVLIRYLLAQIRLYKAASKIDEKIEDVFLDYTLAKVKSDTIKDKVRSTFYNILKAFAILNVLRYLLIKSYREKIREARRLDKDVTRYRRALERLLP